MTKAVDGFGKERTLLEFQYYADILQQRRDTLKIVKVFFTVFEKTTIFFT